MTTFDYICKNNGFDCATIPAMVTTESATDFLSGYASDIEIIGNVKNLFYPCHIIQFDSRELASNMPGAIAFGRNNEPDAYGDYQYIAICRESSIF